MRLVDKSVDDLFTQIPVAGLKIVDQQKSWNGPLMNFAFVGKWGFFSAPLRGTVLVTDKDVTIECELPGILSRFIPEEKVKTQVETKVRGLLA